MILLKKILNTPKTSNTSESKKLRASNIPDPQDPGERTRFLQNRIRELEAEWDRLDANGNPNSRQQEISAELYKLNREYVHWKLLHRAVDSAHGDYDFKKHS